MRTFDTWGPDFNIKLDLKVLQKPPGWHNIIHLTTGEDNVMPGARIPGLWINSNTRGTYLYVSVTFTEEKNDKKYWIDLDKWYKIELNKENGDFSFLVNSNVKWKIDAGEVEFKNVKWYQSDRWFNSAVFDPGEKSIQNMIEIRNLQATNGMNHQGITMHKSTRSKKASIFNCSRSCCFHEHSNVCPQDPQIFEKAGYHFKCLLDLFKQHNKEENP